MEGRSIYQPRVWSICASSKPATARPFIAPVKRSRFFRRSEGSGASLMLGCSMRGFVLSVTSEHCARIGGAACEIGSAKLRTRSLAPLVKTRGFGMTHLLRN